MRMDIPQQRPPLSPAPALLQQVSSHTSPSPPNLPELVACFRNSEGTKPFLSYSLQSCHEYEPKDLAFTKDERLGFVAQPKWLKFWDHVCHP